MSDAKENVQTKPDGKKFSLMNKTLELVKECKISELLPECYKNTRLEASGVLVKEDYFYVIFDNLPHIAKIQKGLNSKGVLLRQRGDSSDFEDITYDERKHKFYVVVEASKFDKNVYKAKIEEYDKEFRFVESNWMDFTFKSKNNGFEGLAYIGREEKNYILALCEGNKCKGGKKGRKPGGGRIQIFQKVPDHWERIDQMKIPQAVQFEDYAGLSLIGDRVAITSQASSALWLGVLASGAWKFIDDGTIYQFPKGEGYCNIEGVAWITRTQIVVVSDKRKSDQDEICSRKDQSIHIFNIPTSEVPE